MLGQRGGEKASGHLNVVYFIHPPCAAAHVGSGNHSVIGKLFAEQRIGTNEKGLLIRDFSSES